MIVLTGLDVNRLCHPQSGASWMHGCFFFLEWYILDQPSRLFGMFTLWRRSLQF